MSNFRGAKLALFLGRDLVVIQRDDYAHIPYPGCWDFPGGGREGNETPKACALRETREEVGLSLSASDLIWSRRYGGNWFFVARLGEGLIDKIRLGDEGQSWRMMAPEAYLAHPKGISLFKARLSDYLTETSGGYVASPE
ncbi:NUDIX hydrolase [Ruegeria sp. 2205SS24-7]|uniref:NUDIX hydrolase n=1 Tax=Ruegeria discodermiae TaxID=3064389 RepID=UPI002741FE09|nr:NUDIX hydrolase [Ruegeria sp. 2205SS24-7]MDP5218384.1 NUDIX hydrolase [Ruegeria sp. 2205SS24-7]